MKLKITLVKYIFVSFDFQVVTENVMFLQIADPDGVYQTFSLYWSGVYTSSGL